MSLSLLASALLTLGPDAIKFIGTKLGKSKVADLAADVVTVVGNNYVNPEAQQVALVQNLKHFNADELDELLSMRVTLEQEATKRHQATQGTIQNGDNSKDEYVRQTRPLIARLSMYASVLYAIGFEGLKAAGIGDGASFEVLLWLFSPALTYMGLRTIDGFAPYSKSSGDKTAGAISAFIKRK
ncbi:hypothetical protein [Arsukibacterium sp.]|uniref:hypothetical protein n=1 Tax=Arsukibacterium sp. TaxID=1977258 RepID=UPI00299F3DE3|nr:hypothetical protein [Arsukibacterium sp.]MDX1536384.1 hypothetical protein [Arsukibacterium sp.]